jgi:hypothetical protein
MKNVIMRAGILRHILLWSVAAIYLFFGPSLYYQLFPREGKPVEVWDEQPPKTGRIRYNLESCKFWSNNLATYTEGETYALWGWAFLNLGPDTLQANYDRFAIVYDDTHSYVFPMKVYPRPGVQDHFKDLGLTDLASSGFYAVISRNALGVGEYGIGLLFKNKQDGTSYYVKTDQLLVRTPNHLSLEADRK